MLLFIGFHAFADQNQNLAIGGTALIIRNHMQLIQ